MDIMHLTKLLVKSKLQFFDEAIEFVFNRNWLSFEKNFMQKLSFVEEMDNNIVKVAVSSESQSDHRNGNNITVIHNSQSKVSRFERKLY